MALLSLTVGIVLSILYPEIHPVDKRAASRIATAVVQRHDDHDDRTCTGVDM
jgi:hypothetical protein